MLETALSDLSDRFGDRLSTAQAIRDQHGSDESWHQTQAPDAVLFARSTEEVAAALKICNAQNIPVIPFGTGTNVEGQVVATHGGICIDLSQMNTILRVGAEDMDCTVQAGVTRNQLNTYLRDTGLFFPIDPGADASIGGMAATRASGTNAVRYGTMRENVMSVKAVLANGDVIETGSRARKSAAAYDLTHLLVGSEGTLGIITEVTLRLHPRPEASSAARVQFDDIETAVNAVILTMQSAIPVARIELLDDVQIRAINAYSKTDYAERPTLLVEFQGTPGGVEEQARAFGEICDAVGGAEFVWTADPDERRIMWQARHDAAYAAMAMRPGCKASASDVCVPISRLADCIVQTREDAAANSDLTTMIAGHVGDGNFHFVFLIDPADAREIEQMNAVHARLIDRALAMGGTCTGEHGIGLGKKNYLLRECGAEAVRAMAAIKAALDPNGIMNPGKKLPDPELYH